MRPNLITRLKEEWNNLDPVDPLRGLIADAIDALAEQLAQQQQEPAAWIYKPNMELLWPDEIEVKDPSKHRDYKPLYTSPPASKPHGFAGVTAWIGDATVTRIVTQVQIQHERVAGQSMKQTAQVCLDMLAAHGSKENT